MSKTIKDYNDIELKALVYDNLAQIEMCQANIKAINQELSLRKENLVNTVENIVEEVKSE